MSIFNHPWSKPLRRSDVVRQWVMERLRPIDENSVVFLDSSDQKALGEFATFCHRLIRDRGVTFTLRKRISLYRRWLASRKRCLMAVKDTDGKVIGCTIVLPLSRSLFEQFCDGTLDAIDIESDDIEGSAPCDHRHLLVDIMAFDRSECTTSNGIPYRALLRHFAELYDPQSHGVLSIVCETAAVGLAGRLRDLNFNYCCKAKGADAFIYRARITNPINVSPFVEEIYGLICSAIQDYRGQLKHP